MREIEFRGKHEDDNEWVYGCYTFSKKAERHLIWVQTEDAGLWWHTLPFVVHKDSIGQFTGLRDKNGCKIYDGDIIINTSGESNYKLIIVYHRGAFRVKFFINKDEPYDSATYGKDYCQYLHESKYSSRFRQNPQHYEVVGNIYLKEKENVR